ncbi:hexosaminidase [Dyella jiangningensis]|uniref:family 20 glycosylhydrolase n=1 Tax=Dyella sp. AtDHG13 TaxID=1938897 RepID=UPI000887969B|nr:family 20 glycosylhydrolase [Dyella sp. AtDHG13]PXV60312.1 hexosaminidase [Dyella sp. AtDHG13]SDJ40321.1 hexosaminidase [Dyella jiangningensis]
MPFAKPARLAWRGWAIACVLALPCIAHAVGTLPIIPLPAQASVKQGGYTVTAADAIHVAPGDRAAANAARYLSDLLARTRGLALPVIEDATAARRGGIVIRSDAAASVAQAEGYVLDVDAHGIDIRARDAAGLFYGAVSAWQLLTPDAAKGAVTVPSVHVADWPRFAWRGLMLDSARHFEPPAEVRQLLDAMAQHKLNVFHWHLTDDQGWRLEIRRYPKLTQVGAWRQPPEGGKPYGGYYTQTEVKDIVAYAAARHITVVPEIDMPGHAQAAVAAYPDIGVTGKQPAVSIDWGVNPYLFNVDDHSITFLQNVLDEVMELFPSTFIHVGGDEAIKDQWQASAAVQARMRSLGLKDEKALQSWFIERMGQYLARHGRRLIGWDEILEGGIPPSASVMSWRGTQGAIDAARLGHDVVLSPAPTLYFDNLQSHLDDEPSGRLGVQTLATVYAFEPVSPELTAEQAKHVLGAQANIWAEYLTAPWQIEHAAFPRMDALAEVAWTPADKRHFDGFIARLPAQFARYRQLDIRYADSAFAVGMQARRTGKGVAVTLATQVPGVIIRYTTDGSVPGAGSPVYRGPIDITLPATVSAASFVSDGLPLARVRSQRFDTQTLSSFDGSALRGCPNGDLGVRVPLLPDATAPAPVYNVDVMNSCWTLSQVSLDGVSGIAIDGAWLARNYGLAHDASKVVSRAAHTPAGEFEVHLDGCGGPVIASLALPVEARPGTTYRVAATWAARTGTHDVCVVSTAPINGLLSAINRVSFTASASGER